MPSSTAVVYSTLEGVHKEHPVSCGKVEGLRLEGLTKLLLIYKVPVASLISWQAKPHLITLWEELDDEGSIDWEVAGAAIRLCHNIPLGEVARLGLPDLSTPQFFEDLFSAMAKLGDEYRDLAKILTSCVMLALDELPSRKNVIVHDDLWPKNFVNHRGSAHLVDWDNAALAPPGHDLAFIVSALETNVLTLEQYDAFQLGYGRSLPSSEEARYRATCHRARWVASLALRCSRGDNKAIKLMAKEAPLWVRTVKSR